MNEVIVKVLKKLFGKRSYSGSDYVFCLSNGSPFNVHHLYREFELAQKKAGIDQTYRFRDLRHTFASYYMMNKGNIYDLQKILGHSNVDMTSRYSHLSPEHLANAMKIVSFSGSNEDDETTERDRYGT